MPIINTALTLNDLPPPSPEKTGWLWTEQTQPLPGLLEGSKLPRISIVTPSYNQGQFIEETMRSVLLQGYPNIEYIIIDGGSTDETLDIIQKYERYIAYWVSEPDSGQADAINKGFRQATGELIGWQNSDDYYYPQAFISASQAAIQFPEFQVIYGSRNYLDVDGSLRKDEHKSSFDLEKMIPNANMANQSMFFRRKVFEDGNFLDGSFHHCMDHEFFWRLIARGYKFMFVPEIVACYRLHPDCKGCSVDNTWLFDTLRICKSVYKNPVFPPKVRQQAWLYLRGSCLTHYGYLRLPMFRASVFDLIAFRGLAAIDAEILIKYLVSFVGAKNLDRLRQFKPILNKSKFNLTS